MRTFILLFLLLPFLLLSCKQKQPAVQNIYVETTPCFGNCPVFKLGFHPDRTVTYKAESNNKETGVFTTTLPPKLYDSLLTLLKATNFPALKESYAVDWTDAPSVLLTIMYDKNQIKRIKDYGEQGTKELQTLYAFVFRLKESQQWKRMP